MLKVFWKSLLVSPAILGATLAASANASGLEGVSNAQKLSTEFDPAAIAQVQTKEAADTDLINKIEKYGNEGQVAPVNGNSIDQVTSVNQLRDVSPTAWAYEALRSLVERYGCIVGYPDRTFRGDRAMTRWEFAAGLNACLNVMERLIQEGVSVLKEDYDKLKRLMDEFQAELAALGARVDNLESRTAFLEDHQFSTTTKLSGEVIFAVTDAFGGNSPQQQAAFQDRVRLTFNTSFTGQDVLKTRLSAGSAVPFGYDYNGTTTLQDGQGAQVQFNNLQSPSLYQTWTAAGNNNDIVIDWLAYYTPIDFGYGRFNTYVAAWGGIWNDFVPTTNPYFEDFDGGNGALSTFSSENPIYRIGGGSGAGVSLQLGFLESIVGPTSVSFGYLGGGNCPSNSCAGNPNPGNGLFNGDYAILGQINLGLFNFLNVGFTYVNAYQGADTAIFGNGGPNGVTGTSAANLSYTQLNNVNSINGNSPGSTTLQDGVDLFGFGGKVSNSYGLTGAINLGPVSLSAFGTYSSVILLGRGNAEIWTYGAGAALPDFGGQGNILGLFAGVQPYIAGLSFEEMGMRVSNITPWQIEAFYKYQVTDNISVTPGVIWVSAPEQFKGTSNAWIGTLRTTFTF